MKPRFTKRKARMTSIKPEDKVRYEPLKYKKMPKEVHWNKETTNSWEDVYGIFIERNIDPTREQIINAFDEANRNADRENEWGMDGFWEILSTAVSQFEDDDE